MSKGVSRLLKGKIDKQNVLVFSGAQPGTKKDSGIYTNWANDDVSVLLITRNNTERVHIKRYIAFVNTFMWGEGSFMSPSSCLFERLTHICIFVFRRVYGDSRKACGWRLYFLFFVGGPIFHYHCIVDCCVDPAYDATLSQANDELITS